MQQVTHRLRTLPCVLQEQIDAMLSGNLSFDTKNGEEEDGEGRLFVVRIVGDPKGRENDDRPVMTSLWNVVCFMVCPCFSISCAFKSAAGDAPKVCDLAGFPSPAC